MQIDMILQATTLPRRDKLAVFQDSLEYNSDHSQFVRKLGQSCQRAVLLTGESSMHLELEPSHLSPITLARLLMIDSTCRSLMSSFPSEDLRVLAHLLLRATSPTSTDVPVSYRPLCQLPLSPSDMAYQLQQEGYPVEE